MREKISAIREIAAGGRGGRRAERSRETASDGGSRVERWGERRDGCVVSSSAVLAERRGKQGGAVSTMHTVTAGAEGASSVRGACGTATAFP
jgi:hypothetical protein